MSLRARVGVVVPPANPAVEPELHALLPATVAVHVARLPVLPGDLRERNEGYLAHYEAVAGRSFGSLTLQARWIAMTGVTYRLGRGGDERLAADLERVTGSPTTTASLTLGDALRALEADPLHLVTPYPDWLTELAVAYWQGAGWRVAEVVRLEGPGGGYAATPEDVTAALARVRPRPGGAVVLSGTGLGTLEAIRTARPGATPLVSSNLAGAWALLRQIGEPPGPELIRVAPALVAAATPARRPPG